MKAPIWYLTEEFSAWRVSKSGHRAGPQHGRQAKKGECTAESSLRGVSRAASLPGCPCLPRASWCWAYKRVGFSSHDKKKGRDAKNSEEWPRLLSGLGTECCQNGSLFLNPLPSPAGKEGRRQRWVSHNTGACPLVCPCTLRVQGKGICDFLLLDSPLHILPSIK